MKIPFAILCIMLFFSTIAWTQKNFTDYVQLYPMGEDPNIRYMSSYTSQESILFEANPIVRYSVYNDFMRGLMEEYKHTQAWYISFRPQLRMYNEASLPIKTPSYKILLGTQHFYRLHSNRLSKIKQEFLGVYFETGHYSNGQKGSAFSEKFEDGSAGSDSIYGLIDESSNLSDMLNRNSGNFSTNLTELILNYRTYRIDRKNVPKVMHSFNIGYTLYHLRFLGFVEFGGYSEKDIRLYGKRRYLLGYEYTKVLKDGEGLRFSVKQNVEIIPSAHKSVNPIRSETTVTIYPFINYKKFIVKAQVIGFFVSYIYGHDNYNFRYVDAGHQVSIGISWCQFPPFAMQKN